MLPVRFPVAHHSLLVIYQIKQSFGTFEKQIEADRNSVKGFVDIKIYESIYFLLENSAENKISSRN